MTIDPLVQLIFERFSSFQTLWSLYIAVALGIVGFIVSAKTAMNSRLVKAFLTFSFLVFATVNLTALENVRNQRSILIEMAKEELDFKQSPQNEKYKELIKTSTPASKEGLSLFHWTFNGGIVTLIWLVPYLRSKYEQQP